MTSVRQVIPRGLAIAFLVTFSLSGQVTRPAQQIPTDTRTRRLDAQESSADTRARETEKKMTDDERFDMIYSLMKVVFSTGKVETRVPADVPQLAGWSKGVKRLGVPDLLQTDAGLGIGNPGAGGPGDLRRHFRPAS